LLRRELKAKKKSLTERLRDLGSVLIAYSGGVDSTLLLDMACRTLGQENVSAVTALSGIYPAGEEKSAKAMARRLRVEHKFIRTRELSDARFKRNPVDRCYYCKSELFGRLKKMARQKGVPYVVDGSNADDLSDYRPGSRAKKEYGVRSPLQEAGMTKKDVRVLSRHLRLPTWDKPAQACLASRIPYHSVISRKRLLRIENAEMALRDRFDIRGNLRVRDFDDCARIEVDKKEMRKLDASKTGSLLKKLGYQCVVIDPKGYRIGSMNETVVSMK
jgi:uncharacterized protein